MNLLPEHHRKWTLWAFVAAAVLVAALLVWQLYGLTPAAWCGGAGTVASADNIARLGACLNVLTRLLDIKDHTVIGLLGLLGVVVIALVVVVLGVNVHGTGPNGIGVDVSAGSIKVDAPSASITVPAVEPPAAPVEGDK